MSAMLSMRYDNFDMPKGLAYVPCEVTDDFVEKIWKIWYVDFETLITRKLCNVPENIRFDDIFIVSGCNNYIDGYIAFHVYNYSDDEDASISSESLMFVSIETGEYFILRP